MPRGRPHSGSWGSLLEVGLTAVGSLRSNLQATPLQVSQIRFRPRTAYALNSQISVPKSHPKAFAPLKKPLLRSNHRRSILHHDKISPAECIAHLSLSSLADFCCGRNVPRICSLPEIGILSWSPLLYPANQSQNVAGRSLVIRRAFVAYYFAHQMAIVVLVMRVFERWRAGERSLG